MMGRERRGGQRVRMGKALVTNRTFYIETFGCQMNAHDSEKVIGTLMAKGYTQVETPEAAELVLYNTCSIRDKAEQKVFHRLQQFKRAADAWRSRRAKRFSNARRT
jgi:tRNA A37 methylthiotransferase MiaB